jgi:hypothetical protein
MSRDHEWKRLSVGGNMKRDSMVALLTLIWGCSPPTDRAPYVGAEAWLPGSLHALEVSATVTDETNIWLNLRNRGPEQVCFFSASYPEEEAARGFRLFSADQTEKFMRDTGRFEESDKICLPVGGRMSSEVRMQATFPSGLSEGDCVLFELPYFSEADSDAMSFREGVPIHDGGVVQAAWIVRGAALIPVNDHCRAMSTIVPRVSD